MCLWNFQGQNIIQEFNKKYFVNFAFKNEEKGGGSYPQVVGRTGQLKVLSDAEFKTV